MNGSYNKNRERIRKEFCLHNSSDIGRALTNPGLLGNSAYSTTCHDLSSSESRRNSVTVIWESCCQTWPRQSIRITAVTRLPLIAPSLHALIERLPLVASTSKGRLALALRQVSVTIFVNLSIGGVAQS